MGITRFATRIHLSPRPSDPADEIGVVWLVDYTVAQTGRETRFTIPCVAEAAARRMVAHVLPDRLPGLSAEDVYTEQLD